MSGKEHEAVLYPLLRNAGNRIMKPVLLCVQSTQTEVAAFLLSLHADLCFIPSLPHLFRPGGLYRADTDYFPLIRTYIIIFFNKEK